MNFWVNNPGVRILLPFVLGIIVGVEFKNEFLFLFPLIGFLILILIGSFYFSKYKNRKLVGVLFATVIFFVGFQYSISRTEKFQSNHFTKSLDSHHFKARLLENPIEKKKSYKCVLELFEAIGDSIKSCQGKVLVYFEKHDSGRIQLTYGDELLIENKLNKIESPKNPNQFDYQNYLDLNQINYKAFLNTKSYVTTSQNSGNGLVAFSQKMRMRLYDYLKENGVEGDQLKVGSALLLGSRENLDPELIKSYASAGAMHVLAVSGLHVGILYLLLSSLLNFFNKRKKGNYIIAFILIFMLWFYALMTGLSASVMRASTMFTFIIIADKILYRSSSTYNTLAVSALILLLINPYMIYQVGFQLSYAAVLGIVYLQPKLVKLVYFKNNLLNKIWAITCVSVAAQIATFPLSLHYFHQFPVYFFISNLIVIPAAVLIFYLGIALFLTAPFGGISLLFGKILNLVLLALNKVIFFTEKLRYSLIEEIYFTVFETYLLYGVIITALVAHFYRKIKLVYLSLSLFLLFGVLQIKQQYDSTQQKLLTFYSIKNETAFEIMDGKTTYFISRKELAEDWNTMLFNVNNNWNEHNITKKVFIELDSIGNEFQDGAVYCNNGIIHFENKVIVVLNENNYFCKSADYLVISSKNLKFIKKINKNSYSKYVIFDSTIPEYKVKYYLPFFDSTKTKIILLDKKYYSEEI